jgi:guanylate kinase
MRTAYPMFGSIQLECEYYTEKDDNWGTTDVVVEKVIYNGTDVTDLIAEIDVEFFRMIEEKIKDRYEI